MKLGFESKGRFQAAYFLKLVEKYLEGGNFRGEKGSSHLKSEIVDILEGLSMAWDQAEEHKPAKPESYL